MENALRPATWVLALTLALPALSLGGELSKPAARPLTAQEQKRFDRLVAEHRKTRDRLDASHRKDLDRLNAILRDAVFTPRLAGNAFEATRSSVARMLPALSKPEQGTLTAYAVDAFAARDRGMVELAAVKFPREVQMSFNLQYLQLQSQMQHENRSYTAVSNIMKTKHDTVKNSINNVR
jgi:hypothetical protein